MTTTREIELDDDGWWTVWEHGYHIFLAETRDEAERFVADLDYIERVDALEPGA